MKLAVLIAFLSGLVALGYEILWARRLSDIIGATSFASSLVVGTFFLALSLGAIVFGPLAARTRNAWRLYALLELGILVAVLPSFFGEWTSGLVFSAIGESLLVPNVSLVVKAFLAILFVAPASFLMGGTLPAMGQAVVAEGRLGREGNVLYGINTLGGASGILLSTFLLVPAFGMRASFLVFMLTSLSLAILAWNLESQAARLTAPKKKLASPATTFPWTFMAFVSGFNILGTEVLSLQVFSQVLHNSAYTFATVLLVVIVSLSVGALVTQRWKLTPENAWLRLTTMLFLASLATALLPKFFVYWTDGLSPFGGGEPGFARYIVRILGVAALLLGPIFVLLGWVFPLVLTAQKHGAIGRTWGRLLFFNAMGALLGLVVANHWAMRSLGLWMSVFAWSAVFFATGLYAAWRARRLQRMAAFGLVGLLGLGLGWPRQLPLARLSPQDRLVSWSAGADGVATVIDLRGTVHDRRIKWNNTYSLGGSGSVPQQTRMGTLALMLHEQPQRVAFIGLATGITASSALLDPAKPELTTVELSPQITRLACAHLSAFNRDICSNSRVVVEDGRLFFRASRQAFDVVVGDLFVPWRTGVANLFTQEHFRAVRDRLSQDGLFVQWLPVFQLDEEGFWGIAKTFHEVFGNTWVALADFQPQNPALALIGWKQASGAPDFSSLERRVRQYREVRLREPMLASPQSVAMFLVGPLAGSLPPSARRMTLDDAWLADHAPRMERRKPMPVFRGPPLLAALQHMAQATPPGPFREASIMSQKIYEFCDLYWRQGPEMAARWYAQHGPKNLPQRTFVVDRPERFNWPFNRETGMFLIRQARRSIVDEP